LNGLAEEVEQLEYVPEKTKSFLIGNMLQPVKVGASFFARAESSRVADAPGLRRELFHLRHRRSASRSQRYKKMARDRPIS
jgi:hypothetical protein